MFPSNQDYFKNISPTDVNRFIQSTQATTTADGNPEDELEMDVFIEYSEDINDPELITDPLSTSSGSESIIVVSTEPSEPSDGSIQEKGADSEDNQRENIVRESEDEFPIVGTESVEVDQLDDETNNIDELPFSKTPAEDDDDVISIGSFYNPDEDPVSPTISPRSDNNNYDPQTDSNPGELLLWNSFDSGAGLYDADVEEGGALLAEDSDDETDTDLSDDGQASPVMTSIQKADSIFGLQGEIHPFSIFGQSEAIGYLNLLSMKDRQSLRQVCRYFYHNVSPSAKVANLRTRRYASSNQIVVELKNHWDLRKIEWIEEDVSGGEECDIKGNGTSMRQRLRVYRRLSKYCPSIEELNFYGAGYGGKKAMFNSVKDLLDYLKHFPNLKRLRTTSFSVRNSKKKPENLDWDTDMRAAFYSGLAEMKYCCLSSLRVAGMDFESLEKIIAVTQCLSELEETVNLKNITIQGVPLTDEQVKAVYADIQRRGIRVHSVQGLNLSVDTTFDAVEFLNAFKGVKQIALTEGVHTSYGECFFVGGQPVSQSPALQSELWQLLDNEILSGIEYISNWKGLNFDSIETLLAFLSKLKSYHSDRWDFKEITIAGEKPTFDQRAAIIQHLTQSGQYVNLHSFIEYTNRIVAPSTQAIVDLVVQNFEHIHFSNVNSFILEEKMEPTHSGDAQLFFSEIKRYNSESHLMRANENTQLLRGLVKSPKSSRLQCINLDLSHFAFETEEEIRAIVQALFERFAVVRTEYGVNRDLLKDGQFISHTFYRELQLMFYQHIKKQDQLRFEGPEPQQLVLHSKSHQIRDFQSPSNPARLSLKSVEFRDLEDLFAYLEHFDKVKSLFLEDVIIGGQVVGKKSEFYRHILFQLSERNYPLMHLDLIDVQLNSEDDVIKILAGLKSVTSLSLGKPSSVYSYTVCIAGSSLDSQAIRKLQERIKNELDCGWESGKSRPSITFLN